MMLVSTASPSQIPDATAAKRLWIKLAIFCALAAAACAACFIIPPPAEISQPGIVMQLPEQVLDFKGTDEPVSEAEHVLLPADTEFAKKRYRDPNGETISAQIVLSGIEHRSIHRPEACLRGQGWSIPSGGIVSVPLKSGHNLDVMVLDITRPDHRSDDTPTELSALYAYFFVSKNAQTPKHFERIAITNLDLLFHNKSHRWAYVIATAPILKGLVPHGKDREQTLEMLKAFIREAAPSFLKSEQPAPPST